MRSTSVVNAMEETTHFVRSGSCSSCCCNLVFVVLNTTAFSRVSFDLLAECDSSLATSMHETILSLVIVNALGVFTGVLLILVRLLATSSSDDGYVLWLAVSYVAVSVVLYVVGFMVYAIALVKHPHDTLMFYGDFYTNPFQSLNCSLTSVDNASALYFMNVVFKVQAFLDMLIVTTALLLSFCFCICCLVGVRLLSKLGK